MEFILERPNKLGEPRAKTGDADGFNGLLPGVLIISRDRKDFLEKHLRCETRAMCWKFRATIAAQNAAAHDGGRQRGTGDPREQRWLLLFQKRNGGERRAHYYTGVKPDAFDERFVLPNDTKARKRDDHVHAGLAWRLPHIGDERLVGFEGHAFLQLPAQHRLGLGFRAREILEVLHEDANDSIGKKHRNVLVVGTQTVAHIGDGGLDAGGVYDVGLDG